MTILSNAQAQVVEFNENRAIQVLASAGSGKTRVLTERVRFLLKKNPKEGVIALTFTNKAADELLERLADGEQIGERLWVATIHGVAQRILEKYGHTIGLPSELHIFERDKDRMEVFLQSLRDDGVDIDSYLNVNETSELRSRERNLQAYMDAFSEIKRNLWTKEQVSLRYADSPHFYKIFDDYQKSLINSNGIDYDDILVFAHKILITNEWVGKVYRSKYKHLCVDEAQDLNKAQYEFIKALCGNTIRSVLMVGDPNQMIYGFNGSSMDFLCRQFVEDFSPIQIVLKENFRSSRAVIGAANKLKPDSQKETDYALEGLLSVQEFDTESDEALWIVSKVKEVLSLKTHPEIEGEINLSKIVVIARNRFVFRELEKALDESKVPFSLRKGERNIEPASKFGRVLDYAIRLRVNPRDWVDAKKLFYALGMSAPSKPNGDGILRILANELKSRQGPEWHTYASVLEQIQALEMEAPNIRKLVQTLGKMLEGLKEANLDDEEIKLSLDELQEFSRCWTLFRKKGLGESLLAFKSALALGQLAEHQDSIGLTLSTVHTMKGLEKDIVFLMGMCEGVFPDYRAKSKNEMDEERNNAFVAVTRAKRWLFITNPSQRVMPWGSAKFQQQSRFVKEIMGTANQM
jgi:DNA helicase-2/ATP-dependent DNA helicase PcrA